MSDTVIVALIAFAGTLIGTLGGIMASGKLTSYRIEELEKKVDKHNRFAQRMPVVEEQMRSVNKKIEEIEKKNSDDKECK